MDEPIRVSTYQGDWYLNGVTLRDLFAAFALAGIVAGVNTNPLRAKILSDDAELMGESACASTAGQAYELADAMLAARTPTPEAER